MAFARSSRFRPILIGLFIGVIGAGLFFVGMFQTWSALVGDRLFLPRASDPSIAIIAIDDASLAAVGRWPWARSVHADLISKLSSFGVSVIGYDVNFPEASGEADDARLAEAIRSAGNVVLPIELTMQIVNGKLVADPMQSVQPMESIRSAARILGHTNTPPDIDGVVRRIPLGVAQPNNVVIPAFAVQVIQLVVPSYDFTRVPADDLVRAIVNFNGPPGDRVPRIPAKDVLNGTVNPASLRGKAVFVGATAADLHDDQLVPTSNGTPMPGVEIHASFYDTLLTERWLEPVPKPLMAGLLVVLGILISLVVVLLRARYSVPVTIALWISILVTGFLLFDRGTQLDLVWPTLVIIAVYAAVTLERRVMADRERRKLESAFSRYVSTSVVRSILKDPSKLRLGGEKRRMSVLFSDVRGFTTISEKLTPEALVDVMNTYLTRMTDIVFENDGVLDKYIGDAVMAFWNAPFDQKDHALRAVKTALTMQKALRHMNEDNVFGNDLALQIGVGINTGEMIVGNMGSETRFDYTVIGDAVNLASRMEGITKEYGVGILITEATRSELRDEVITRRIDKVAVKGKKEPVTLYEVIGLPIETGERMQNIAKEFEAALDAYFAQDFQAAISRAEAILVREPADGPSKTLIERSKLWMTNPPPPGWDGTWVFTKK
jgi:adenylate cyclase